VKAELFLYMIFNLYVRWARIACSLSVGATFKKANSGVRIELSPIVKALLCNVTAKVAIHKLDRSVISPRTCDKARAVLDSVKCDKSAISCYKAHLDVLWS
jgi:hypothetical protein